MTGIDWFELLASTTSRQQYYQQLEGLQRDKQEALAAYLFTLQLVAYLREYARLLSTSKERAEGEEVKVEQENKQDKIVPERGIAKEGESIQEIDWSTTRDDLIHLVRTQPLCPSKRRSCSETLTLVSCLFPSRFSNPFPLAQTPPYSFLSHTLRSRFYLARATVPDP